MAKQIEEALLLFEPPVKVQVIAKGPEQSRVRMPDGGEQAFSNEWLVFEITDEMEDELAAVPKEKKTKVIVGRQGKVAVDVNGQQFDSVRKAFNELKLPLREKSRVRRQLRTEGTAKLMFQEKEYLFTRLGNADGDSASAVDC